MGKENGLAPMRWLDSMPYGKIMRRFADEGPQSPSLRNHLHAIGEIVKSDNLLQHDLQKVAVVELSRLEKHEGKKLDTDMVMNAIVSADVAIFHAYGRQVFHLDHDLVDELCHTDVDDVPCDLVKIPHLSFYLSFENPPLGSGTEDIQGYLITSAENTPTYLQITAMRMKNGAAEAVDVAYLDLGVHDIIKNALAEARSELPDLDPTRERPADWDSRRNLIYEGFQLYAQKQAAGIRRLEASLRLIINALLYISTSPPQKRGWHPQAPNELAIKTEGQTGASKAEQQLVRDGWTRVNLLSLQHDGDRLEEGQGARRGHRRRGHWRNQRFGPQLSLSRVLWIRPVYVRGIGDVEGRHYHVSLPDKINNNAP